MSRRFTNNLEITVFVSGFRIVFLILIMLHTSPRSFRKSLRKSEAWKRRSRKFMPPGVTWRLKFEKHLARTTPYSRIAFLQWRLSWHCEHVLLLNATSRARLVASQLNCGPRPALTPRLLRWFGFMLSPMRWLSVLTPTPTITRVTAEAVRQ